MIGLLATSKFKSSAGRIYRISIFEQGYNGPEWAVETGSATSDGESQFTIVPDVTISRGSDEQDTFPTVIGTALEFNLKIKTAEQEAWVDSIASFAQGDIIIKVWYTDNFDREETIFIGHMLLDASSRFLYKRQPAFNINATDGILPALENNKIINLRRDQVYSLSTFVLNCLKNVLWVQYLETTDEVFAEALVCQATYRAPKCCLKYFNY